MIRETLILGVGDFGEIADRGMGAAAGNPKCHWKVQRVPGEYEFRWNVTAAGFSDVTQPAQIWVTAEGELLVESESTAITA